MATANRKRLATRAEIYWKLYFILTIHKCLRYLNGYNNSQLHTVKNIYKWYMGVERLFTC